MEEQEMAWICADPDYALEDVKRDRRSAKFIEKYGFSEKAVYDGGKYLPLSRILSVRIQPSFYHPGHCCGSGIPVFKIRLDYGLEKPFVLMMERESNAQKAVSMILAANPKTVIEENQAS